MQGFRERQPVAQTHESTDDRPLSEIVSDMEAAVRDFGAWALAVRTLGCGKVEVEPAALDVIGRAMIATADDLLIDWQRCFALTRGREAAR